MRLNPIKAMMAGLALLVLISAIAGCEEQLGTNAPVRDKPYSETLEKLISEELSNKSRAAERPDYLPADMFSRLPPFPEDFYQIRTLVRVGRITDFAELEPEYWEQPEFFPNFEEIGIPALQNPPENRWGVYGILTYPADVIATISPGDSLDTYFFIKSSYLVQTYQGINFDISFPAGASITSGVELPDGSKSVQQDSNKVKDYFDVQVDPNPFILDPNFPIYNINGTRKIKVTVTASEDTPPGNYIVALDTGKVPEENEKEWLMKYLNLYTSGGMVKLDRPYYQLFINVPEKESESE